MRAVLFGLLILAPLSSFAHADVKFLPMGHSRLKETANPPKFGSPEADFNLRSDMYESHNYWRKKTAVEFDNRVDRFSNKPNIDPTSNFIDY